MKAPESVRPGRRCRVLCVDDNDFCVSINTTILRNQGYEVLACTEPLQAMEIIKSEKIDVAVLDYQMPKMNGAELAAFCKAANPNTKVILYSGWLGIPKQELALADLFVQKADGLHALLEGIEALLAVNATYGD